MQLISPALQATAIFLTSATAITVLGTRLSDIAAAILLISLCLIRSNDHVLRFRAGSLFAILLFFILLSSLKQIWLFEFDRTNSSPSNAIAIPASLIIGAAFLINCHEKRALEIISAYCRIVLISCFALFSWEFIFGRPEWIAPREVEERFSAFSNNPNQLALFLLPLPFFSIICHLKGLRSRSSVTFEVLLAIFLNALVMGKALFIAWTIGLLFMALAGFKPHGPIKVTFGFFLSRTLLIILLLAATAPVLIMLYSGFVPGSQEGQGAIRLALWVHGLEAWGDAPLLGHGPGHYSGLEAAYASMEAHNFFIDWASAYGALGVLALCVLIWFLVFNAFRRKNWIVCAFFVALISQITFHFYGRQPAFWLWCALGFILSKVFDSPRNKSTINSPH